MPDLERELALANLAEAVRLAAFDESVSVGPTHLGLVRESRMCDGECSLLFAAVDVFADVDRGVRCHRFTFPSLATRTNDSVGS